MEYRFIDTFPTHLFIEMMYGDHERHGILKESLSSKETSNEISKEYGLFPGCHKLSKDLWNAAWDNIRYNKTFSVFGVFDNVFIDEIHMIFDNSGSGRFLYDSINSKFDENGKFKPLILYVDAELIKKGKGLSSMMHELTHAYEDYCRKNNNAESITQNSSKIWYFTYNNVETDDSLEEDISNVLYYLTDFERNANVAKLAGELKSYNGRFESVQDALDYLKDTDIYHNYQVIFSYCQSYINEKNKYRKDSILKFFNNLSNQDFKNYNELRKWLIKKLRDYQKKFTSVIPKIISDNVKAGMGVFPQKEGRIDENKVERRKTLIHKIFSI